MTNVIVKLHGVSGAGKTTAVKSLLEAAEENTQKSFPYKFAGRAYEGKYHMLWLPDHEEPVYLIGNYAVNTGGVDSINDINAITSIIDVLHKKGHVVFEGLLISTYYGFLGQHSKQYGDDYIYAFLTTPEDECVRRVMARREIAGITKEYNPIPAKEKFKMVERVREKVYDMGHTVFDFAYDRPIYPQWSTIFRTGIRV
jgi:hypothetical protein